MDKIQAVRLISEEKFEFFEKGKPEISIENEVLIKVKSVGICGSDLLHYKYYGIGSFRNKEPIVLGHEITGIVEDSKSNRFKAGDAVVIHPDITCGVCEYCKNGKSNLCNNSIFLGSEKREGGLQEYLYLLDPQIEKLPSTISKHENKFNLGTLLEPLAISYYLYDKYNQKKAYFNPSCLIYGAGPLGICFLTFLKLGEVKDICIADKNEFRLNFIRENFKNVITCKPEEIEGEYSNCFNMSSDDMFLPVVSPYLKKEANIYLVGIPNTDNIAYNPHKARIKEYKLINIRRSPYNILSGIYVLRNNIEMFNSMITHTFNFKDTENAFKNACYNKNNSIKTVINFK